MEITDDQLSGCLRGDGLQMMNRHEITGKGAGVPNKDRLLHDTAWYNLQRLPKFDWSIGDVCLRKVMTRQNLDFNL